MEKYIRDNNIDMVIVISFYDYWNGIKKEFNYKDDFFISPSIIDHISCDIENNFGWASDKLDIKIQRAPKKSKNSIESLSSNVDSSPRGIHVYTKNSSSNKRTYKDIDVLLKSMNTIYFIDANTNTDKILNFGDYRAIITSDLRIEMGTSIDYKQDEILNKIYSDKKIIFTKKKISMTDILKDDECVFLIDKNKCNDGIINFILQFNKIHYNLDTLKLNVKQHIEETFVYDMLDIKDLVLDNIKLVYISEILSEIYNTYMLTTYLKGNYSFNTMKFFGNFINTLIKYELFDFTKYDDNDLIRKFEDYIVYFDNIDIISITNLYGEMTPYIEKDLDKLLDRIGDIRQNDMSFFVLNKLIKDIDNSLVSISKNSALNKWYDIFNITRMIK